jgi:serine/threonine protein kinase
MGAVYETTDLINGKRWAVKEMSESSLLPDEREQAVSDFQREATILRTLDHPNLPKVADLFNIAGRYYMVMEFVAGRTLQQVIDDSPNPLDWKRVQPIAMQLCDVLAYLHRQNPPIIYRDLKPGNIMLLRDDQGNERVKLIDFGIARFHQPGKTRDTTTFGTAGYAPPEQYGRDQTDARSDIYALGATLHHLLSHRDPGLNPFNFGPIRDVNPSVPPEVEKAILKATSTDAASRWPDAASFKAAMLGQAETKIQAKPTKEQRADSASRSLPPTNRAADLASRAADNPSRTRSGPLTSAQKRRADTVAAGERALVQPRLILSSNELDFGAVRPAEVKARRSDVGLIQRRVSLVNAGSGTLLGKVRSNKPWLQPDLSTFDTTQGGSVRSINVGLRGDRLPLARKRQPIANVYRPLYRVLRRNTARRNLTLALLAVALLAVAFAFGGWPALGIIAGVMLLPQLLVLWYAAHVYLFIPTVGEQVATLSIVSNGGERAVKVRATAEPTRWQILSGHLLLGTALAFEAIIAALLIWQQLSGWLLPDIGVTLRSWFSWLGF